MTEQIDGVVTPSRASRTSSRPTTVEVDRAFTAFVGEPGFPCLGAKGAVGRHGYRIGVYGALAGVRATTVLASELSDFLHRSPGDGAGFTAFVAVFPVRPPAGEGNFERRLWKQLQRLHECDPAAGEWDPSVSDDPHDPHFSFSFDRHALFVVGLHPDSSRLARRFRWPSLVFNPHAQFQRLRAEGRFDRLRTRIREKEIELQGSLNPNLADFGEASEARQYSGRETEADWSCPFHRRPP
ncbi:MAG: guanitoxin biosynthesis heme-dependent pre-guanitoxin N-hydroxylase GntA [Gemmatimonadaceae bacterium]